MATLNLGRIKPVFRGAYNNGTAYVIDDIVTSGGETFICIQASTGNAVSSATYWTKLAEKGTNGTNGTDVGTTITTQGDILYRDGSGLARLPAGTNGQALLSGGSGANPSWGSAGKNMVLQTMTTQSALTATTTLIDANIVTSKANPTLQVSSLIALNTRASGNLDDENIKFDIEYSTNGGSSYTTLANDIYKTDVFSPGYSQTHSNNYDINTRPASASVTLSGVSAGTTVNVRIRLDYSAVNNGQEIFINRSPSNGSGVGSSHLIIYEE